MSTDTLISSSGTLASIGLAMVGILAAKSSLDRTETVSDDLFLFSALGFLFVVVFGYLAQRNGAEGRVSPYVRVAEWVFSISMLMIVTASVILVYAEI